MACASGIEPLQLPWRNVSLSSDGLAFARGIAIQVGNPPQILSLNPSTIDMDSWVFDVADCGSEANHTCAAQLGGVFNPLKSSTFVQTTQSRWNGTAETALNQGTPYVFFNDEIYVGNTGAIPGFPLLTDTITYADRQSGLGLGQNSSFLSAVYEAGLAPSKEWSLWVGSKSIENPIDGMLIVGGFDGARAMGSPAAFKSYTDCSLFLNITGMSWNSPTGSNSLMANSSDTLYACVDPYVSYMDLRSDIYERFHTFTGGSYADDSNFLTYPSSNIPIGNMTITLDGGYTTIIPAEELFFPPRDWDENGAYAISNDSVVFAEVRNLSEPQYYPQFGYPFMTMNYFVIDWESYDYIMSPANRTNFDNNDVAQNIASLCASSTGKPTRTPAPLPPSHTSAAAQSSTSAASHSSSSNSTTPIIAGVVGGVLGLALIASVLAFFLIRNRRKNRLEQQRLTIHGPSHETAGPDDATISSYRYSKQPAMSIMTDTTQTYTEGDVSELPSAGGHLNAERQRTNHMDAVPEGNSEDVFTATSGPVEMPAHHY